MRNKVLVWALVLIGVFLLGFLPSYMRASGLQAELRESADELRRAEVRDLAAMAAIQAAQKNYGLASQTTSQFFNRVREAVSTTENPARRSALENLMKDRDSVTGALAKGDPAAVGMLQAMYLNARAATTQ
ncbi:MAG TPA: hypothetical protein VN428_11535 [Bryobacteraceae bacterium]|nr:hypothetical protein [Bryobacteraceae bacterium]